MDGTRISQSDLGLFSGKPGRDRPLPIVRPAFPPLDAFADAFAHALDAGMVTNNGPNVRAFEAELSDHLGVPTLVFSSGQSALMVLLASTIARGGEVIVPSYTFCATPHAVVWAGARPVFADVDPVTLTLDVEDVERKITADTVAILGVCSYGIPCDYAALDDVARRHRLRLIYDSAPAFGTTVAGRPIGHFGDGQIFSFHATKAFATMEGGALSSSDPAVIEKADAIRNFGQKNGMAWGDAGINGKMMEVAALIGRTQLPKIDAFRARRCEVARMYRAGLEGVPGLHFASCRADEAPIWLYFPVRVDPGAFGLSRDEVMLALEADNIFCRKYFDPPCHLMPAYAGSSGDLDLPVTQMWASNVIALPVYNDQTDEEADYIIDRLRVVHDQAARIKAVVARSAA